MRAKTAVFAALLAVLTNSTDAGEGDEHAEFQALCTAWLAAKALRREEYTPPPMPEELTEVLNLNMSISEDKWAVLFDDNTPTNKWETFKQGKSELLGKTDWSKQWEKWKQARHTTKNPEGQWVKKNKDLIHGANQQLIRRYVARQADRAFELYSNTQEQIPKGQLGNQQDMLAALNAAMCSTPYEIDNDGLKCKDLGSPAVKATTCGADNANKAGKSIGLDIACLCVSGTNSECTGVAGSPDITSDANIGTNALNAILAKCPGQFTEINGLSALNTAIAAVSAQIGKGKKPAAAGDAFFGKTYSTNCGTSSSACLSYKEYFATGQTGVESITWVKNLRTAAKHVEAIRRRKQADNAAKEQILTIKIAIEAEFARELKFHSHEQTKEQKSSATQQNTEESLEKKRKNCEAVANNATCQLPCKWETKGTSGVCKLDESKVKDETNQGTGGEEDAGGTPATGCAQHFNDKEKCEKMNEGKEKPVCAWKKGGEGDKDKDELRCRNGSFLANKQFSLMISAAFMALLF
ncbi:Trypanosomal VSG domain/Trypanosome variant surface glycoprotein C-terminal domain containing protein, putative [Trypanosoma equiperdum]|uniref:Trypanosomal VSG domain/Trypanosome variant surface glycoprotein C-terminal domain containing protein, putative n=1 Tax=Trypanosoma equiperdum TaxID=5694 RepID=A0A1G4IAV8_TRYEQ|nr:Trypanosomal VSG domain/Trypanosome variant surface glycoprotein C-terminal domain containing protein, putative [Trypanosoma equiperdum]